MSDAAYATVRRDLNEKVAHWRDIADDRRQQAGESESLVSKRYNQGQALVVTMLANELEQYVEEELTPPDERD